MNQLKREFLTACLRAGESLIILDARQPGVCVPEQYASDADLKLKVSFRYSPPDLTLSDWGVRITLSFSGVRSFVQVPWEAIYAVANGNASNFWPVPDEPPILTKRRGILGLVS